MTDQKWMIIEAGGKQHFVTAGSRITTNRNQLEVGETLAVTNLLDGSPVSLTVVSHGFGPKINGLKFKNKVRYLKRYGHKQPLTTLEVVLGAKKAEASPKAEKASKPVKVSKNTTAKSRKASK